MANRKSKNANTNKAAKEQASHNTWRSLDAYLKKIKRPVPKKDISDFSVKNRDFAKKECFQRSDTAHEVVQWLAANSKDEVALLQECYDAADEFIKQNYEQTKKINKNLKGNALKKAVSNTLGISDLKIAEDFIKVSKKNNTFSELYELVGYEEKSEETSLYNVMRINLFWNIMASSIIVFKNYCNDEKVVKKCEERLKSIQKQSPPMFFDKGYMSAANWVNFESDLVEYYGTADTLFFLDFAVFYFEHSENTTSERDTVLLHSIKKELLDYLYAAGMKGKITNKTDIADYIRKNLLNDETEMALFISGIYYQYQNILIPYLTEKFIGGFYEISDNTNLSSIDLEKSKNKLTRKLEDQLKTIKQLTDEKTKLETEAEQIREEYQQLNQQIESKLQSAVKKATKEKAEEISYLKKKLKEAAEENEQLMKQLEINESKTEETSTKEDSDSDFAEAFELSSYLKIRERKIVFVRSKYSEGFAIFDELEKAFPNAKFVDAISDSYNAKTTDCVVLMTRCMKHYTYWTMKEHSKNNEIPIVHCNSNNINIISQMIHETLK